MPVAKLRENIAKLNKKGRKETKQCFDAIWPETGFVSEVAPNFYWASPGLLSNTDQMFQRLSFPNSAALTEVD